MFDLRRSYGFNKEAADKGAKFVVGADPETDYVLVRMIPNDEYRQRLIALAQANSKKLDILKEQDPKAHFKLDRELQSQAIAETVITGWGSGFGDNGEPVEYSVEACMNVLDKYPSFRSDIIEFAADRKNFPLQPDIEDAKKS